MSVQRLLLVLAALGAAFFGLRTCIVYQLRTPESLLESAESRLEGDTPDWDGGFRELTLGYELASARGDLPMVRKLLLRRANAYADRLAFDFTLRDCRLILERCGPDAATLELGCRTAIRLKDFDQALELAQALRHSDPKKALGVSLVGLVQMGRADAELGEARDILLQQMADAPANAASQLARQVAATEAGTSRYAATLGRLRILLPDGALEEQVLGHVAQATSYRQEARAAFLESLDIEVGPEALDGLIEILSDAGALEESVELGKIALSFPKYRQRWGTVLRTAQGLVELGRIADAGELLGASGTPPFFQQPPGDLVGWCELLRQVALWPRLASAGGALLHSKDATEEQTQLAPLYQGLAYLHEQKWEEALDALKTFGSTSGVVAFPGARSEAWIGAATAARRLDRPREERRALNALMRISPRAAHDAQQAQRLADAWVRLANLQRPEQLFALVEQSLTQAMRYDPARIETLRPAWEEADRQRLARTGRSFLGKNGLPQRDDPAPDAGPCELLRYAEYYLAPAEGPPLPARSAVYARRVLSTYPDFLPVLDVLGRALIGSGDFARAAETIVREMEVGGTRPELDQRLLGLPQDALQGELAYRWARVDPEVALLEPFVDQLLEDGRFAVALGGLNASTSSAIGQDQVLLRKLRPYTRLRAWPSVLELGMQLDPAGDVLADNASLLVQALASLPEQQAAKASRLVVKKLLAAPVLRDPELPHAIDALFAAGMVEPAHAILLHMDGMENRWGGDVTIRLAVAETLLGRLDLAREYAARAEVFQDSASAAVARIVLASAAGRVQALPVVAAGLGPDTFGEGDRERGLTAALRGSFQEAIRLLGRAQEPPHAPDPFALLLQRACEAQLGKLAAPPADAPPADLVQARLFAELFYGYGENLRDPRETIVLWLAARDPVWSAWALHTIRDLPHKLQISPWPLLVEVHALRSLGDVGAGQRLLRQLMSEKVTYALLELEDLVAAQTSDPASPELLTVRAQRALLFGEAGWSEREATLVHVFQLEEGHKKRLALALLEEAGRRSPEDPVLALLIGRKREEMGLSAEALDAYQHLLDLVGSDGFAGTLPEYLAALQRAGEEGRISEAAWVAELEGLEALAPREPAIQRELARRTLAEFGQGNAEGFRRAWQRLDDFRTRTDGVPIESLRHGEAARWLALYLEYDPDRGVRFSRDELFQDPTSLELWWGYAQALARHGDLAEAAATCETVLHVVPDERFEHLLVDLQLETGAPAQDVLRHLDSEIPGAAGADGKGKEGGAVSRARRVARQSGEDPVAVFQRARALLRLSPAQRQEGALLLAGLWSVRGQVAKDVDPVELGTVYASTLFERGPLRDPDRALAVVRDTIPACRTAARRDFLHAFAAVAKQGLAGEATPDAAGQPKADTPEPSAAKGKAKRGDAKPGEAREPGKRGAKNDGTKNDGAKEPAPKKGAKQAPKPHGAAATPADVDAQRARRGARARPGAGPTHGAEGAASGKGSPTPAGRGGREESP